MKINGFYICGLCIAEAVIDLDTKEVISEDFTEYNWDASPEDLDREYVEIDGVPYPCCQKDEAKNGEYWYK